MEGRTSTRKVGATVATIAILRYLGASGEPRRLVQIARDLGMHASTCLNILRTLVDEGMVSHHVSAKSYAIGLGAVELARRALMRGESLELIQPLLDNFSHRHGVSVLMWRRISDAELMVAAYSTVGALVHIRADIGARLPLLTGSMGRIMAGMGDLDEESLRACFDDVAWEGEIDFDTFLAEAQEARSRGWAADRGTMNGSWHGISAPVPDAGPLRRILAVPMFNGQFPAEKLADLGSALVKLAAAIGDQARPHASMRDNVFV